MRKQFPEKIKIFYIIITGIFTGILLIIIAFIILDTSRNNATPQVLQIPPDGYEPTDFKSIGYGEMKAAYRWRIAFIPKFKFYGNTGRLSDYWQRTWEGAWKEGTDFGVDVSLILSNVTGETDSDYIEPQTRLILDRILKKSADGIVFSPFDSHRLAPVAEKAVAAGIPVIVMDTPVHSDKILTLDGFNNRTAGRIVGEWIVSQLHEKGTVFLLDGPLDQDNAVNRGNGFLSGLKADDIKILGEKSADRETRPAEKITSKGLGTHNSIDAIIAANDNRALGAAQAVAATHRRNIIIKGFDTTKPALSVLKPGLISATVDQEPDKQTRLAVQLLIRHLFEDTLFPARVYLPEFHLITATTMDTVSPPTKKPER